MREISANACEESLNLLLSFLYPLHERDMTPDQWNALGRAAEEQAKFDSGNEVPIKSRSVGDVSVTYDTSRAVSAGGRIIAPGALAELQNAGLLCRWV